MVEVHRAQKCRRGLGRLPAIDETTPPLLIQPAEARMMLLESRKRGQRIVWATQVPLRYGHAQQGIAVIGNLFEQGLPRRDRLDEPMLPDQRPQPL
jgi:hypothetical protein